MCKALEEVAQQVGVKSIQAVAIAYVMQKTTYVFPIIGGRKVEHLEANIEALDVALSDEQIKYLESVLSFEKGFPHSFIVSRARLLFRYPLRLLSWYRCALGRWHRVHCSHEERCQLRHVAACPGHSSYPVTLLQGFFVIVYHDIMSQC